MSNKPTPHPHAELIKAWADGAKIQIWDVCREVWQTCELPTWLEDCQYRINPEPSNEPCKPGEDDMFYSVKVIRSVIDVDNDVWSGGFTYEKILKNGNVFRTREEAEAAAERVKAALKGDDVSKKDAEIKKLTEELETLKIRCKNLQITKEQLIASRAEIDALTDGEIALIKALRRGRLFQQYMNPCAVVVEALKDGNMKIHHEFVAFCMYSNIDTARVRAAIKQIKAEKEATR